VRGIVNHESGWEKLCCKVIFGSTRTSWQDFTLRGLRPANGQILAKKYRDGKKKMPKSEDECDSFPSALIVDGHRDSHISPAAIVATIE
jgi:hypothetical protein